MGWQNRLAANANRRRDPEWPEASPAVLVASLPMQRTGPPLRNTCIRHAGASAAEVHNPRWQRCCAPSSFGPWIANPAMLTQLGNATFIEVGVNRLPGW